MTRRGCGPSCTYPDKTPDHDERRKRYCAIQRAQIAARIDSPPSAGAGREDARAILEAAADGEARILDDTAKRGTVAGDVLTVLYTMSQFPDSVREPGLKRAIYVVEQFGYKEKHYADGTPLPRGRTEIRRCFNDMRPVAHLWAAFRLHHEHPVILHDELLRTNEGIRWLLHIAREVQDFARAWRPTREKKHFPLLSKIRGCCRTAFGR